MKNIFGLALISSGLILTACGSSNGNNNGSGGGGPTTKATPEALRANFQDFVGHYKIASCVASVQQSDRCKFQTAEVKFEDWDAHPTLVVEQRFVSPDGKGEEIYGSGISVAGHPDVNCTLSYGTSECVAVNQQAHPGAFLKAAFARRSSDTIVYRSEIRDPQVPGTDVVLEMTLVKK